MEQQLKQRLLGTVVLIAIAVIVLPLLLDGEGYRALQSIEIDAPQRPKYKYQQEGFTAPLKDLNNVILDPQPPIDVKQFNATEDKQSALEPSDSNSKTNRAPLEAEATTIWVMQVGSFSVATNAEEVRQKLLALNVENTVVEIEMEEVNELDVYVVKVVSSDYQALSKVAGLIKKDYPDAFIKERE